MRVRTHFLLWSLLIVLSVVVFGRELPITALPASLSSATTNHATNYPSPIPTISETFTDQSARSQLLEKMTLEEKVGQLFMVGHWHQNDFYHTANLLRAHHFGGVIIMDVDPRNSDFVSVWTREWQEDSVILPAFVAIDQEGGVVTRLRGPEYTATSQRDLTSAVDAVKVGTARGEELSDLGITINLAPVLDTSTDPESFLYKRSFSNPASSSLFADTLIYTQAQSGVLSAVKHYPGHADTTDDSHVMLPIIPITRSEYAAFTAPFTDVIQNSEPTIVMTAHVLLPNLDPSYPATLSREILTNQLRNTVGFDGIIMTDDMTMGAITNTWTTDEAAIQAINAGADMILFAAEPNAAITAVEAVVEAVNRGEISEDRINQSVDRILKVKEDTFDISLASYMRTTY